MDSQFLSPGTILRDTYRIERVLGRGGFGITYLATDITLERPVAIKEFFPKEYCDRQDSTSDVTLGTSGAKELVTQLKAKFLKEARNIAKFGHPGIIKIHSAFEANNTAYYVMEFIDGCSLSEWVRKNGSMKPRKAVDIICKVGNALDYVHARRINHLDVKPGNIMLSGVDGVPTLIDFGLSKQYDSQGLQTSSTPAGVSHGYAPVEQYKDGGVREFAPQTDVYSLGATLYYLVSGVRPPEAMSLIDEDLEFPVNFPDELKAPIRKAMMTRRSERYPTVKAFTDALTATDHEPEIIQIGFDDEPEQRPKIDATRVIEKPKKDSRHDTSEWKKIPMVLTDEKRISSQRSVLAGILMGIGTFYAIALMCVAINTSKEVMAFFAFGITGVVVFRFFSNVSKNGKILRAKCQSREQKPYGIYVIFTDGDGKFGVYNRNTLKVLINPQYDKMEWVTPGKVLKVKYEGKVYTVTPKNRIVR